MMSSVRAAPDFRAGSSWGETGLGEGHGNPLLLQKWAPGSLLGTSRAHGPQSPDLQSRGLREALMVWVCVVGGDPPDRHSPFPVTRSYPQDKPPGHDRGQLIYFPPITTLGSLLSTESRGASPGHGQRGGGGGSAVPAVRGQQAGWSESFSGSNPSACENYPRPLQLPEAVFSSLGLGRGHCRHLSSA